MSLEALTDQWLITALLVFARIAAIVALMPILGERAVPARVKLGAALGMSVLLVPLIAPAELGGNDLPAALLREIATGLLFGLIFRLLTIAIQMAGVIIAQSGSLAQMFQGMADEASPVLGSLLNLFALALAATLGLHFVVVEVVLRLYAIFPLGLGIAAALSAETMIGSVVSATALAFQLSAGFVLAALIYNTVIGFANRVMPQLMLTMIGAPAISLGTLALLYLTFPHLMAVWIRSAETLLAGYR